MFLAFLGLDSKPKVAQEHVHYDYGNPDYPDLMDYDDEGNILDGEDWDIEDDFDDEEDWDDEPWNTFTIPPAPPEQEQESIKAAMEVWP